MIGAAWDAFEQILTPPFRGVLWKSLGATVLILAFAFGGLERLIIATVHLRWAWAWVSTVIHLAAGAGLVLAAIFLVPSVSFVVASFFFDEMADHVEAASALDLPRGRRLPILTASWIGLKFTLVSIAVYAVALALLFVVPGINGVILFSANAYLLGRGFFELAALRYVSLSNVRELRARYGLRIMSAGIVAAAMSLVPILNLLTPLFATALLVRVAQRTVASEMRRLPYPAVV